LHSRLYEPAGFFRTSGCGSVVIALPQRR
jgi:hypothetical protein